MTSTPLTTNQDLDAVRLREAFTVTATGNGSVTLDDGLAMFECTVYREVEAGDHTIVLHQPHAIGSITQAADTGMPLVFHRSGFGTLADSA